MSLKLSQEATLNLIYPSCHFIRALKTWESKAETCKVLVSGIAYFSDASALAV